MIVTGGCWWVSTDLKNICQPTDHLFILKNMSKTTNQLMFHSGWFIAVVNARQWWLMLVENDGQW